MPPSTAVVDERQELAGDGEKGVAVPRRSAIRKKYARRCLGVGSVAPPSPTRSALT